MKVLDGDEFAEYMEYARETPSPSNNEEAGKVIAQWFGNNPDLHQQYCGVIVTAIMAGADPVISLWATAFQMGREFEQRLVEKEILEKLAQ